MSESIIWIVSVGVMDTLKTNDAGVLAVYYTINVTLSHSPRHYLSIYPHLFCACIYLLTRTNERVCVCVCVCVCSI
jgi:hypothetical protein